MTWHAQLQLLQLMQKCIGPQNSVELPSRPPAEAELRGVLERFELTHRQDTDAAIRAFSRTGRFPELSAVEKYFVGQRLDFAVWVALALAAPEETGEKTILPDPPETFETEDHVEWLLISAWRVPGYRYWVERTILCEQRDRRSS
jgi:hypothetical protein